MANDKLQPASGGKGSRRKNKEATKHVAFQEEVKKITVKSESKTQKKPCISNRVQTNESFDDNDDFTESSSDD